jgi:hypothetical protein
MKMSRRNFTVLSAAALGGIVAGCSSSEKTATADASLLTDETHVCRGLNMCQGKGLGGANACAGQGKCANVAAHSCHGTNDCKGQGGCGEHPGENACKGQGKCAVPLSEKAWAKARVNFEAAMKKAGKTAGAAPAA